MKTVTDILAILMKVELNFATLYHNMAIVHGSIDIKLKTACLVLERQEREHAKFYERLILEYQQQEPIYVNDALFEVIQHLVTQFKNDLSMVQKNAVQDLLEFAVSYEYANGRVLETFLSALTAINDPHGKIRQIVEELLRAETRHIDAIEVFL